MMTSEERLIDLEIRFTRQDDLLDTLNRTVYEQQKKLDELEAMCSALARHIKAMRDAASDGGAANEKPPHY
jgi:SlyX protein